MPFSSAKARAPGLITTKGFRDVYEIGRGNRPEGYNLFFKRPVPLVPRDLRLEVDERLYATGEVLKPLDEASAARDDRRAQSGGRGEHRCLFAARVRQCGA